MGELRAQSQRPAVLRRYAPAGLDAGCVNYAIGIVGRPAAC